MITFLIVMIVLDTFCGIGSAVINSKLSSSKMKNGLIKNTLLVVVIESINYFTPPDFVNYLNIGISGFIATQVISIFENLGEMGVEIPTSMKKILESLNEDEKDEK
ncbi:MAG: holin [Erysipelotrichia bacterium]|nr:holin [Erysipelotrichia bacterium]